MRSLFAKKTSATETAITPVVIPTVPDIPPSITSLKKIKIGIFKNCGNVNVSNGNGRAILESASKLEFAITEEKEGTTITVTGNRVVFGFADLRYKEVIPNTQFDFADVQLKQESANNCYKAIVDEKACLTPIVCFQKDVIDSTNFALNVNGSSDVRFGANQTGKRFELNLKGGHITVDCNQCVMDDIYIAVIGPGKVCGFRAQNKLWTCMGGVGGTIQGDMSEECDHTGDQIAQSDSILISKIKQGVTR